MYYLVNVDHNGLAACITRSDSEVCCISSALYGTDDDMLWNGNEEAGNVRSECEGDEGTDFENGDSDTDW